jgi:xanthine phosphoribosyltransferase
MNELVQRIKTDGIYLGKGIIKVDGFLNHQIDSGLVGRMGEAFVADLTQAGVDTTAVTKIITAESSGISPALATGMALDVPVIYARKKPPLTMSETIYTAEAPSRTKGDVVKLMVSPLYLLPDDRVLIIDDFLATGQTLVALVSIVRQAGAELLGVGCVIEKVFEPGRGRIEQVFDGPVVSLAKVDLGSDDELRVFS